MPDQRYEIHRRNAEGTPDLPALMRPADSALF
jgi:hypothetical protein